MNVNELEKQEIAALARTLERRLASVITGPVAGLDEVLGDFLTAAYRRGRVSAKEERITLEPPAPARRAAFAGCDLCGDHGPVVLRSRCHITAPLALSREGDELVARCFVPTCAREVARFEVRSGPRHPGPLGVGVSCENADRHIARLGEYLAEANDEVDALRKIAEAAEAYHVDCGHDEEGAAAQCDPLCDAWKAWSRRPPREEPTL